MLPDIYIQEYKGAVQVQVCCRLEYNTDNIYIFFNYVFNYPFKFENDCSEL